MNNATTLIRPFSALLAQQEYARKIAAPPYDVLSSEEARVFAQNNSYSFLHISKAEIDFPSDIDSYAAEVYQKAQENFSQMLEKGLFLIDEKACYYTYRLKMGEHVQTGLIAVASVAAYNTNRIRKHEFTRPDKEDDRVRQIKALAAQTGPVLLASPNDIEVDSLLAQINEKNTTLLYNVDLDGINGAPSVNHQIARLDDAVLTQQLTDAFDQLSTLYIADGHHRSAAAARVHAEYLSLAGEQAALAANSHYFLAVIFPQRQMRIYDYNRVVSDLNNLTPAQFLAQLSEKFSVEIADSAVRPEQSGEIGVYLAGQWYKIRIKPQWTAKLDPVASLDVSLLTEHVLSPLLGISDLRRDKRIDFIGGIRGLEELEERVDSGKMAVAFAMFPPTMQQLMSVADAEKVMPPKSTWFEPKLADGLISHSLLNTNARL